MTISRHIDFSAYPRVNTPALKQNLKKALEDNYHRVNRHTVEKVGHGVRSASSTHMYVGIAGIIVMHDRVHDLLPPEVPRPSSSPLLEAAVKYCPHLQDPTKPLRHCSSLETDVGVAELVLTHSLIRPENTISSDTLAHCVRLLHKAKKFATQSSSSECEFLYGRAGLLAGLLRIRGILDRDERTTANTTTPVLNRRRGTGPQDLRDMSSRLVDDHSISQVIQSIIHCGRTEASFYQDSPPLMWTWHSKRYLGAAHGVAGILHTLMACPRCLLDMYSEEIVSTIEWLVRLQDTDGNWPTRISSSRPDLNSSNDLVQWCHGAPGICIALASCLRSSKNSSIGVPLPEHLQTQIFSALARSADLIYSQGLLAKGRGLCHGIAGTVYALLAISQVFRNSGPSVELKALGRELVTRASHMGYLATLPEIRSQLATPDRPWSLYEGLAGMCCAWADLLRALNGRKPLGFPAFDDIGEE